MIEINADVILSNLFATGMELVTIRDLNATKDALAEKFPNLYVDVSDGSICMAIDQRPDLFIWLEDAIYPKKKFTSEYVDKYFNWRVPEKDREMFVKTIIGN